MGRPPKFTRAGLQRAALRLVDEHGLEALSMRALASELGTGPMTLYNHVRDRNDLELLLVDAVLQKLQLPAKKARDGHTEVMQLATAMWRGIRMHPQVVPLILMRPTRSPEALELGQALVAALGRAGFRGKALRAATRATSAFITGFAIAEYHGPLRDDNVSEAQLTREFQAGITALLKR